MGGEQSDTRQKDEAPAERTPGRLVKRGRLVKKEDP